MGDPKLTASAKRALRRMRVGVDFCGCLCSRCMLFETGTDQVPHDCGGVKCNATRMRRRSR